MPTEYSDTRGLVHDLQRLLGSAELSDAVLVTQDGARIAAHSAPLCARSLYLSAALRSPWRREAPNAEGRAVISAPSSAAVVSDVIEYLTTGCVQLGGVEHAGEVARYAHQVAAYELAELASAHIVDSDDVRALVYADGHAHPAPPPLYDALRTIACRNPTGAVSAVPRAGALLLTDAFLRDELDPPQRVGAAHIIRRHFEMLRAQCSADEIQALQALLRSVEP